MRRSQYCRTQDLQQFPSNKKIKKITICFKNALEIPRMYVLFSSFGLKLTHAVILSEEYVDMSNVLLHGIIC